MSFDELGPVPASAPTCLRSLRPRGARSWEHRQRGTPCSAIPGHSPGEPNGRGSLALRTAPEAVAGAARANGYQTFECGFLDAFKSSFYIFSFNKTVIKSLLQHFKPFHGTLRTCQRMLSSVQRCAGELALCVGWGPLIRSVCRFLGL